MVFSKYLSTYVGLKTNSTHEYYKTKSKMHFGFYYYTPKNRITSNDNYVYFSTLFDLLSQVEPSLKIEQKSSHTGARTSVFSSFKPNLDLYEFFSTQFLKNLYTENVVLMKSSHQILFLIKNHILIFKDVQDYDMELYEEKFDDPFIFFIKFDRKLDLRFFDLVI